MAKYCGICGEKCDDHTMYCSRCGERFPGEPSPAGGIKGFLTKKLICAAAAAFGVVLALVLIFSGRLKTIHLEDFVTITSFDNASGSGTVTCRFDRDALETRLYENAKVSDRDLSFSNLAVYGSESYDIISRVELEVENNGKLRNGDDVVVNVTYNGENKSKIFKSKIEGGKFILRHCKKFLEPVFIDLLSDEYLQVTFSGADGFGTCSVKGINGDTLDADLGDYFLETCNLLSSHNYWFYSCFL